MGENTPETRKFVASIHRLILGVLLTVAGLIGLSFAIGAIQGGSILLGIVGLAVAGFVLFWIATLFIEGLQER